MTASMMLPRASLEGASYWTSYQGSRPRGSSEAARGLRLSRAVSYFILHTARDGRSTEPCSANHTILTIEARDEHANHTVQQISAVNPALQIRHSYHKRLVILTTYKKPLTLFALPYVLPYRPLRDHTDFSP